MHHKTILPVCIGSLFILFPLIFPVTAYAADPVLIDVNSGDGDSSPDYLVNVSGTLYFAADDGTHGKELWKASSTTGAAEIVKDINPGSSGSYPSYLVAVGSNVYFWASDGSNTGLWKSDGSDAGTVFVKSIEGAYPKNVNGKVFFWGDEATHGQEPWVTDGTSAGTFMLADVTSGTGSTTSDSYAVAIGSTYYFTDRTYGKSKQTVWKSDGTPGGTVQLGSYDGIGVTYAYNDGVYFAAIDDSSGIGQELYYTTGGATALLADIGYSYAGPAVVFNNYLYFWTDDDLWRTDGTTGGTVQIESGAYDIAGGTLATVAMGNYAYFVASDKAWSYAEELWRTGPSGGATMVKDINTESGRGSSIEQLTVVGNELYFIADGGGYNNEVWKTDGTTAGTSILVDPEGTDSSSPDNLTAVNGALFYSAYTTDGGTELYWLAAPAAASPTPTLTPTPREGGDCTIVRDFNTAHLPPCEEHEAGYKDENGIQMCADIISMTCPDPPTPVTTLEATDVLSRNKINTASNHTISFKSGYGLAAGTGYTMVLAFPDFDLSSLTIMDIELTDVSETDRTLAGTAAANTWGVAINSSAKTITFTVPSSGSGGFAVSTPIVIKLGTNAASGAHQMINPADADIYTELVTLNNRAPGEKGDISVPIVDSDTVNITSYVNTFINFDIDTGVTDVDCNYNSCTTHSNGSAAANYTIDLGELSSTWINRSNDASVMHSDGKSGLINSVFIDITTNAYGGAIVYVTSANGGLKGAGNNLIGPVTDGNDIQANDGTYGFQLLDPATGNGIIIRNTNCIAYTQFCGLKKIPSSIFTTNEQPVDNGRIRFDVAAAASYTNNPGSYTDTLTFTATATF